MKKKKEETPYMAVRARVYTPEEFDYELSNIRAVLKRMRNHKHTMTLLDVQDTRDELAISCSLLADMGVDLRHDMLSTETTYRHKLLERIDYWEKYFWKTPNPDRGDKKWTDIDNRARYAAEKDCKEERVSMDLAKRNHTQAYNLYSLTLPKVLDSLSTRIGILIRQLPLGVPAGESSDLKENAPRMSKYKKEDDGFDNWDVGRVTEGLEDELNDLEGDLIDLEN